MPSESGKIIYRRFMGRLVESGLLIIAVALGIGAASSGFSLLANTVKSGREMLATVTYRELVVSTRSSADEMTEPATRKSASAEAVLTSADLDAATLAPSVAFAYVRNEDDMHFINSTTNQMMPPDGAPFGGTNAAASSQTSANGAEAQGAATGQGDAAGQNAATTGQGAATGQNQGPGQNGFPGGMVQMSADELKKAQAQADIVIVNGIDDLRGFNVTPQFFEAWKMKAAQGSLLSDADASASQSSIVLGSSIAARIAGEGQDPASLVGKKLLAREGYQLVLGILAPTGQTNFDESFFSPYKTYNVGAGGPPRRGFFNTQLRFTVSDASKLAETESLLSGWFDSRFGENQIVISNPRSEAQKLINRNSGISLLILFLSISGLFIALVNVSHILMSRGLRMRKGVGIMMALGASRGSVLALFSSEASAVSLCGAILGGLFAFPLARSMQSALGLAGGSWIYVVLGILVSWLLTLVFSVVPAWQNSRIVPAEAMRAA